MRKRAYPRDYLLDLFLVRLAFQHIPDLLETRVLFVSQGYNLIESTEQLERVGQDGVLGHGGREGSDDANDQR